MSVPVKTQPPIGHDDVLFADLNDPTAGRVALAREMASAQTSDDRRPGATRPRRLRADHVPAQPGQRRHHAEGHRAGHAGRRAGLRRVAQLLAGMWEFRKGNVFGATVFSSYGAFWLSFWAYLTFFAEASRPSTTASPPAGT